MNCYPIIYDSEHKETFVHSTCSGQPMWLRVCPVEHCVPASRLVPDNYWPQHHADCHSKCWYSTTCLFCNRRFEKKSLIDHLRSVEKTAINAELPSYSALGDDVAGPVLAPTPLTLTDASTLDDVKLAYRRVLVQRGIDDSELFAVDHDIATTTIRHARRQLPLPTTTPSESLDNATTPLPPLSFLPILQAYCCTGCPALSLSKNKASRHKCNGVKSMQQMTSVQVVPHTRAMRRVALVVPARTSTTTTTPQAAFAAAVALNPQAHAAARALVDSAIRAFSARSTHAQSDERTPESSMQQLLAPYNSGDGHATMHATEIDKAVMRTDVKSIVGVKRTRR